MYLAMYPFTHKWVSFTNETHLWILPIYHTGEYLAVFPGIGAAMLVVSCILAIYYNMIIAWAIYYLIASFTAIPSLPWQNCDRAWATPCK